MRKSQTKQLLLASILGPLGLSYCSLNAALAVSFTTLIAIHFFSGYLIFAIPACLLSIIIIGATLVHFHNKKMTARDFTLSTYIGRVSCKVVGKRVVKPDYHASLSKARRVRKFQKMLTAILAVLCVFVSTLISLPYLTNLKQQYGFNKADTVLVDTTQVGYSKGIDPSNLIPVSGIGVWQTHLDSDGNHTTTLKANDYQHGSNGLYRARLAVVCRNAQLRLQFQTDEILGTDRVTVGFGYDDGSISTEHAILTSDYKAAMLPDSKLRHLAASNSATVEYLPFATETKKQTMFGLANSAKAIAEIKSLCI